MITLVAPKVTALQAQATANLFLNDNLPDRFTCDQPRLSKAEDVWLVPVVLCYPFVGSIGQVGEVVVSVEEEKIISHTPLDEMKQKAIKLYEANRNEIEAAFSSTRNS
jgi:hypothetical protein